MDESIYTKSMLTRAQAWNRLHKEDQKKHAFSNSSAYWDSRVKSFSQKRPSSGYLQRFLELADIQDGENVLDMGCGTGSLALHLGQAGHDVLAADFSPRMLEVARSRIAQASLACVHTKLLSWEEDWQSAGIMPESYDVCLASRSFATEDMLDSILKLTTTARRRICATVCVGSSPQAHDGMLRSLGIEPQPCMDMSYMAGILQSLGYLPRIDYISTKRTDVFDSYDEAFAYYFEMIGRTLRNNGSGDDAEKYSGRLVSWLAENLVQCDGSHGNDAALFSHSRSTCWAFVCWNKLERMAGIDI